MGNSTQQNDANGGTPLAEPTGWAEIEVPTRMTKAWLRSRSDHELNVLTGVYPYDCCRGIDIRDEINRRKPNKVI